MFAKHIAPLAMVLIQGSASIISFVCAAIILHSGSIEMLGYLALFMASQTLGVAFISAGFLEYIQELYAKNIMQSNKEKIIIYISPYPCLMIASLFLLFTYCFSNNGHSIFRLAAIALSATGAALVECAARILFQLKKNITGQFLSNLPTVAFWVVITILSLLNSIQDIYFIASTIWFLAMIFSILLIKKNGLIITFNWYQWNFPKLAKTAFLVRAHIAFFDVIPIILINFLVGAQGSGLIMIIGRMFGPLSIFYSSIISFMQSEFFLNKHGDVSKNTNFYRAAISQLAFSFVNGLVILIALEFFDFKELRLPDNFLGMPNIVLIALICLYRVIYLNYLFLSQVFIVNFKPNIFLKCDFLLALLAIPLLIYFNQSSFALLSLLFIFILPHFLITYFFGAGRLKSYEAY